MGSLALDYLKCRTTWNLTVHILWVDPWVVFHVIAFQNKGYTTSLLPCCYCGHKYICTIPWTSVVTSCEAEIISRAVDQCMKHHPAFKVNINISLKGDIVGSYFKLVSQWILQDVAGRSMEIKGSILCFVKCFVY